MKLTWLKGLKAPRLEKSAPQMNTEAKNVEITKTERKINDAPSSNELNSKMVNPALPEPGCGVSGSGAASGGD